MKKFKSVVTMLIATAMLLMFTDYTALEASAAEPVTFAVKYVDEVSDWRFLSGTSTFDDNAYHRELYYMYEQMKDGDIVVVYNTSEHVPELDLGSKRISNLTVVETTSFTVINAGEIQDCFLLAGTSTSINANITNAYLYDTVLCNLGGNVGTLTLYAEDAVHSTIGCAGTVGHLYVPSTTLPRTFFNYYDFQPNTLHIEEGVFQTPAWAYNTTPSSQPDSKPSKDEYDDVPKTGESNLALWLLAIAALCAGGSICLKKES